MRKREYRKDIDGLRAISILGVLLFHLDSDIFSGGFVGVDVFFVISGFLITQKLAFEQANGDLSLLKFYGTRIIRLLPALFSVVMITFFISAWVLYPQDLQDLSRASILSIFPFSNILYYTESGYFDVSKLAKPLLHTWSLGVEEQFYFIWPLLIVLTSKTNSLKWYIIGLAGIASFVSSIYTVQHNPQAAFFLTHYRIFEFSIGALTVLVLNNLKLNNGFRECFLVIGISLIISPMLLYSSNTPFPGIAALIPCLGTSIAIISGQAKHVSKFLENPLFTKLGKMSYSIYLVHWPIIALSKYGRYQIVGQNAEIVLFASSILFGALIHYFIEIPFWKGKFLSSYLKTASGIKTSCSVLLLSISILLHAWLNDGWTWRQKIEIHPIERREKFERLRAWRWGDCFVGNKHDVEKTLKPFCYSSKKGEKNAIIIGSSHAGDLYPGIQYALTDWKVYQIIGSGCYPTLAKRGHKNCDLLNKKIFFEVLTKFPFDLVILNTPPDLKHYKAFEQVLERLNKLELDYVVIGPRIQFTKRLPELLMAYGKVEGFDEYLKPSIRYPDEFNLIPEKNYFSILSAICISENQCRWRVGNSLLFYDNSHFTVEGSMFMGNKFADWLKKR